MVFSRNPLPCKDSSTGLCWGHSVADWQTAGVAFKHGSKPRPLDFPSGRRPAPSAPPPSRRQPPRPFPYFPAPSLQAPPLARTKTRAASRPGLITPRPGSDHAAPRGAYWPAARDPCADWPMSARPRPLGAWRILVCLRAPPRGHARRRRPAPPGGAARAARGHDSRRAGGHCGAQGRRRPPRTDFQSRGGRFVDPP